MSLDSALEVMEKAERLTQGREYTVASPRVLELVMESSCSAYDCEFVALAEELGVRLVTGDTEILSSFPRVAVAARDFTS